MEKQADISLPRIRRNIDQLEAFSNEALKNKINDDNKKSQGQISKMKKSYDDLQKLIDALNNKLQKVKQAHNELNDALNTEDMEKDNEIRQRVGEKITGCDRDINGDKAERASLSDERLKSEKLPSLQARKKDIIAQINKMVNQYNDNNKVIKDLNKLPKGDDEMNDLINKNLDIMKENKKIEEMINGAKEFGKEIDQRLDEILDPTIPEIKEKYDEKNDLIDKCDEIYDDIEKEILKQDEKIAD